MSFWERAGLTRPWNDPVADLERAIAGPTSAVRSLMALCEDCLRARGVPKLNLMVRTSNASVAAFYDAPGYETDSVVVRSKRLA